MFNSFPVSVQSPESMRSSNYEDGLLFSAASALDSIVSTVAEKGSELAKAVIHKLNCKELDERLYLAQQSDLSSEMLSKLATDRNPLVRAELAWNTSAPESVLRTLMNDKDPTVVAMAHRRLTQQQLQSAMIKAA